ncbi:MAG: hypothetical protein AAF471_05560 [Myxococcota bacterium]
MKRKKSPRQGSQTHTGVKPYGGSLLAGAAIVVSLAVLAVLVMRPWGFKPLDHRSAEDLIQQLYPEKRLPFRIPQEEKDLIDDANRDLRRKTSVYGELKLSGTNTVLSKLNFANKTFIDLGGGRGVQAMYIGLRKPVKAAISIELSETRSKIAQAAWKKLAALQPRGGPQNRIKFYQADILESFAIIKDADVLYWCDTMYSRTMRETLLEMLERIPREVHIFSLKRMPRHPRLRHIETFQADVTWREEGAPLHHYVFLKPDSPLVGKQGFFVATPQETAYAINSNIFYKMNSDINEQEALAIKKAGYSPAYETLSLEGVERLLTELAIKNEDRVFLLGGGIGKTAVALYMRTLVQGITGIEISPTRHVGALRAKRKLFSPDWSHMEPNPDRTLEFIQGDFLREEVDLGSGTIFYACSKHFSADVLKGIVDRLAAIPREVTLVLFSKLPADDRIRLIKTFQTPTSWSDAADVFVYRTVLGEIMNDKL